MKSVRARDLKLFEYDEEEKLLGEIPRSNVGVLFIAFNALFLSGLILALLYFALRYESEIRSTFSLGTSSDLSAGLAAVFMLVITLILVGSIVAAYVYVNSYTIVTTQKLVLINTKGIFARRVSQLSIGDIQDVSVDQNNALARLFNYGHINIETAGEQAHFTFTYADNPNENAKYIVDAHEENLKLYGN